MTVDELYDTVDVCDISICLIETDSEEVLLVTDDFYDLCYDYSDYDIDKIDIEYDETAGQYTLCVYITLDEKDLEIYRLRKELEKYKKNS